MVGLLGVKGMSLFTHKEIHYWLPYALRVLAAICNIAADAFQSAVE